MFDTAQNLRESFSRGELVPALAEKVGIAYRESAESGQLGAWNKSIPALLDLLCGCHLSEVQVFLEYQLPYSPRRVDAILCGVHPDSGRPSYVLVELKQWERAKVVGPGLVLPDFKRGQDAQPDLHPAEQVRRYCRHLLDFTPSLARRPALVKGLAYLHNAKRTAGWQLDEFECDDFGQLYTADQVTDLVADLESLLDTDPQSAAEARLAALELVNADHAPARTLLKVAADSLATRTDFVLLDEQQVAFEVVGNAVTDVEPKRDPDTTKKVIVVRGGPGSGKSAIAISLYNSLARRGLKVTHATGSKAFTETLREVVFESDKQHAEEVFKYFNNFDRAGKNGLDVLICDEAHRLRGQANVPARWRGRLRGQIHEIIDAAKVPVFLLDDDQVVRPKEVGSPADIIEIARAMGCKVQEVRLDGQFRCGGSPLFDVWVRRLLGLVDDKPVAWSDLAAGTDDEYAVESVDAPHALESWLRGQARGTSATARIAAGFCWKWSDPEPVDGELRLVDDVQIGGWRRPWNAQHGVKVPGVPSASFWASDPRGFGQIGCIYTAQGFEYDWAGVIFGGDLVIRDGRWVARSEFSEDRVMKNVHSVTFDRLVRNTYKVLLTRGMQGVCIFSTDPETNNFLRKHTR